MNHVNRIIRLPEVCGRVCLSRSTIWAYCRAGTFPKPIKLGARAVGWNEADVTAWIEAPDHRSGGRMSAPRVLSATVDKTRNRRAMEGRP